MVCAKRRSRRWFVQTEGCDDSLCGAKATMIVHAKRRRRWWFKRNEGGDSTWIQRWRRKSNKFKALYESNLQKSVAFVVERRVKRKGGHGFQNQREEGRWKNQCWICYLRGEGIWAYAVVGSALEKTIWYPAKLTDLISDPDQFTKNQISFMLTNLVH